MSIKIKIISPVPVRPEGAGTIKKMIAARRQAAGPETQIDFINLCEGPNRLANMADRFLSASAVLPEIIKAPGEGYQAVIIDCTCDQLFQEANEEVDIPVVSPLHASIHAASMLCDCFGIITPSIGQGKLYRRLVKMYGFDSKLVSVREKPFSFIASSKGEEEIKSVLLAEGKAALEGGAEGIILGCTALTQNYWLQDKLNVPVLAPGDVAVKVAEMLITLRTFYSPLSYPSFKDMERQRVILDQETASRLTFRHSS